MTVSKLLGLLRAAGCSLSANGWALEFDGDVPRELEPYVELLQTGLRAMLKGRQWFGLDDAGRGVGPLADHALDFRRPLPPATRCLSVEGEIGAGWDVIDPRARSELHDAFAVSRERPN